MGLDFFPCLMLLSKKKESQKNIFYLNETRQENVFLFLTSIFDNIYSRLNWCLEDFRYPLPFQMLTKNPQTQSEAIINDLKLITSFSFIDDNILMKWYHQYHRKNFLQLGVFYWNYLVKESSLVCQFIKKLTQVVFHETVCSLQENTLKDPDFFENSQKKCESCYDKIISEIENSKCEDNNYPINTVITCECLIIREESKKGNFKADKILGDIYKLYSNSLSFLHYFRAYYLGDDESIFEIGYFYYKGPDLNNDNLISGFSLGLGMDYGYFNIDLSVTKSNDYSR